MRVTEGYLHSTMIERMAAGKARVSTVTNALASGMKVQAPSEDPVLGDQVRRLDSQLTRIVDGLARVGGVSSRLQSGETALGEAAEVFARAYELCLQMDNDTYTGAERAGAAEELRQLRASLLSLANTQVSGEFVFGGRNESQAPFDAAGLFVGDTLNREVELVGGLRLEATMSAESAFAGQGGGIDVFALLDQAITALDTDDRATVAGLAENMELAREQLTAARAELGCRMNLIQRAESFAERLQENLKMQRRDLIDTDVAEAATELSQAQSSLQAAVSVTSRLLDSSVLRMLM